MPQELAVLDKRHVADLTLELSFVLTAKTLLSEQHGSDELPLPFVNIYEDYMKLAGLVLELPPLDFAKCSYSLRSFAKKLEKDGFITMESGLSVTEIHHSVIDDIYPDATVFAGRMVGNDEGVVLLDDLLDPSDLEAIDGGMVGDEPEDDSSNPSDLEVAESGEEETTSLSPDAAADSSPAGGASTAEDRSGDRAARKGEVSPAKRARDNKRRLTRKMALLRVLHRRQEEKQLWLEQKHQKQTRKLLERELRKTNIKSDGERRDSKYETLLSQDSEARAFHYKHTKSVKAAEMMLAITHNTERLYKQLRDVNSSNVSKIVGSTLQREEKVDEPQPSASPAVEFTRPDDESSRAQDDRGAQKHQNKGLDSRAPASESGTALGTNLKVVHAVRKFLVFLGFNCGRDLADLPDYSELRSAYKRALLAAHPDKSSGSSEEFEQLQAAYQDLISRYYDSSAQDFSKEVKAHRKPHKPKAAKEERSSAPATRGTTSNNGPKEGRVRVEKGLRAHRLRRPK